MSPSTTAPASNEDAFRPSPPADLPEASSSGHRLAVLFSSGNPRIEETRGVMHLHPEDAHPLPAGRKPLVCVLEIPNHMTYADFCQFCGSFVQHILEIRIVRTNGMEDKYSALLKFDNLESADGFYQHFNSKRFSSLEVDECHILFAADVQYTASIDHVTSSLSNPAEQPTCPVCLERLDQETGGILTTICNHSFHCSCISKWTDSSCPVCRYCQQQLEKSICCVCETSENLWICVICGFVGCGRYKEGHAIMHWKETEHCYSLELETQRVWDYVGDNYVHRLIQSKTDGMLVELNHHCGSAYGSCECTGEYEMSEALLNSKVDAIVEEYHVLLASQLENQRNYFESLLLDVKEETEREISKAIEKAVSFKLHKIQTKLKKTVNEKKFLADINENLVRNQEMWNKRILEAEERENTAVKSKDRKITSLEKQLHDLMLHIEAGRLGEESPASSLQELEESVVVSVPGESSSGSSSNKLARKGQRRR